jgi:signal transduction histidine kinase
MQSSEKYGAVAARILVYAIGGVVVACLGVAIIMFAPSQGSWLAAAGWLAGVAALTGCLVKRELRRVEDEMELVRTRQRELDEMKSALLTAVSHELRTPVTSILGFAKLVDKEFVQTFAAISAQDEGLSRHGSRIRENLEIIGSEGQRLAKLINDVLDLSRIEQGDAQWLDASFDPAETIRQAAQNAEPLFATRPGVELVVEIGEGLPEMYADAERVGQVVGSLLANAARHAGNGRVILSAKRTKRGGLHLSVADRGRSIPDTELESVFDKLSHTARGDAEPSEGGGAGLGLFLARRIVEHYGGRIWAESRPGRGASFHVEFGPEALGQSEMRAAG